MLGAALLQRVQQRSAVLHVQLHTAQAVIDLCTCQSLPTRVMSTTLHAKMLFSEECSDHAALQTGTTSMQEGLKGCRHAGVLHERAAGTRASCMSGRLQAREATLSRYLCAGAQLKRSTCSRTCVTMVSQSLAA